MKDIALKRVNITVVYNDLTNTKISRDFIKDRYKNEVSLVDAPQNNLLIDFNNNQNDCGFQARFDSSHLYVNTFAGENEFKVLIDEYPLQYMSEILNVLNNAVENKDKIEAYGFNFEGVGELKNKQAGSYFKDLFMNNPQSFEKIFGGEITKFAPQFMIDFDNYTLNIDLEPGPDEEDLKKLFKFHFNVHFRETSLISKDDMVKKIITYYNKCKEILEKSDLIHNKQ